MARYTLENQNFDGDFLLGINALGYRNNVFTHPPVSSSNRHDQPRSGQLISAPTTRPCGPLRVALVLDRVPETTFTECIFYENRG